MNTIRYYPPHPLLRQFVDCYMYNQIGSGEVCVPSLKENFLQFVLRGNYRVVHRQKGIVQPVNSSIFIGQRTLLDQDFTPAAGFACIIVYFKPMGAFRLLGLPMQAFTDTAVQLEGLLERRFQSTLERLQNTADIEEMMPLMDAFLLRHSFANNGHNDYFQKAVNHMVVQRGDVSLPQIIRQCFMSERQFQRKFLEQVGVSPKTFIKRLKFDYIINVKLMQPSVSWTKLAYSAGYFDQAHFIRDFKTITDETPSGLFKKIRPFPELVVPVD